MIMQPNMNCPQTVGVSISGGLCSSTLKILQEKPKIEKLIIDFLKLRVWYNAKLFNRLCKVRSS